MAIACDASSIAEAAKCFQNPCIDPQDRMAIAVYLKVLQLATAGGTDYSTNLDQLFADSVGIIVIGHSQVSAESLALLFNATAGAPADVNAALELVKCIRCKSLETLRQALLFLQCSIDAEG